MAQESLTQSEIDALLAQNQDAPLPSQGADHVQTKAVVSYNFRKQKKFNKGQFVVLERIHKRFLRNFEVTLTNLLNSPVMANLAAVTELVYSDCAESFSSPTCLYSLSINDGMGKFLLEVGPNLAFFVIDKILGGKGEGESELNRELSLIEERIMGRVVRLINKDLIDAWDKIDEFKLETDGFFAQSDYVQIIGPTDSVILISVDVRKAEKVLGYLNFCLPCSVLEVLLQSYEKSSDLQRRSNNENLETKKNIEYQMAHAVLPVRAVLGETQLSARELLNLKPGDLLFLPTEADKPIHLYVGDLKLYKGQPVKKENSITIKINQIIKQNTLSPFLE